MKELREREQRAPEDINRDATWDRLMAQDGVDADAFPVHIYRYHCHGPYKGVRRRVILATYLCRQRERKTLHRQLDLVYAHVELNGEMLMRKNRRISNKDGTLMQQILWSDARR